MDDYQQYCCCFFEHNAPHSAAFNGFDPWAPRIAVWNVGDCRRQQTGINALQTVSKQKVKAGGAGGQRAVTDTDHLTLHSPDGLSRHNITPWSTGVKQARACHSLTWKIHVKRPSKPRSHICKHDAEAPQHLHSQFMQVEWLKRKWVTYFSHVCHPVSSLHISLTTVLSTKGHWGTDPPGVVCCFSTSLFWSISEDWMSQFVCLHVQEKPGYWVESDDGRKLEPDDWKT